MARVPRMKCLEHTVRMKDVCTTRLVLTAETSGGRKRKEYREIKFQTKEENLKTLEISNWRRIYNYNLLGSQC